MSSKYSQYDPNLPKPKAFGIFSNEYTGECTGDYFSPNGSSCHYYMNSGQPGFYVDRGLPSREGS